MQRIARRLVAGFTLIELMIVVAIIGILAAIAVPNFVKFQCRSKQSEAKTNLKSLYVAYQSYKSEYDNYPHISDAINATNHVGWHPKGRVMRYNYTASGGTSTFKGAATGFKDSVSGDLWNITQMNDLGNTTNVCT